LLTGFALIGAGRPEISIADEIADFVGHELPPVRPADAPCAQIVRSPPQPQLSRAR